MMDADVIVVGGGLAGGLISLRLALVHPEKRVLLLESGKNLGGNHTWSFYETDVSQTIDPDSWLAPLLSKTWDAVDLRFPRLQRTLERRFHSIRSDQFHKGLKEKLDDICLSCTAKRVNASEVELTDGKILRAPLVIDARGIATEQMGGDTFASAPCGWRKYIGFDVILKKPHGLTQPILIDATVPQMDGYRHFTCLPWDETHLFVIESFASSNSELNFERISRSITSYIERKGWELQSIERREEGTLPLPMQLPDYDRIDPKALKFSGEDFVDDSPVHVSSGAGWFHSATGHSFPDAVRVAEFIADLKELRTGAVRAKLRDFRAEWAERQVFYRTLNRMVFRAAEPSLRFEAMEKFYSQPLDLIERFNAGVSTSRDRMRLLTGNSTIRFKRAMKNWPEPQAQTAEA